MPNTGRKPKSVRWDLVAEALKYQATIYEICIVNRMDPATIEKHCKKDHGMEFREWASQFIVEGRLSLRRAQFKKAMGGDVNMLKWLGQNWLCQSSRKELVPPEKKPVELETWFEERKDQIKDASLHEEQTLDWEGYGKGKVPIGTIKEPREIKENKEKNTYFDPDQRLTRAGGTPKAEYRKRNYHENKLARVIQGKRKVKDEVSR